MITLTPEIEKQLAESVEAWADKYATITLPEHDRFCMFMGARIGWQAAQERQTQKGAAV